MPGLVPSLRSGSPRFDRLRQSHHHGGTVRQRKDNAFPGGGRRARRGHWKNHRERAGGKEQKRRTDQRPAEVRQGRDREDSGESLAFLDVLAKNVLRTSEVSKCVKIIKWSGSRENRHPSSRNRRGR